MPPESPAMASLSSTVAAPTSNSTTATVAATTSNSTPATVAAPTSNSTTAAARPMASSSPSANPPLLPLPHPFPLPHSILGRPPPNPPPSPTPNLLFARCYPHKSPSARPPDHAAYPRSAPSSPYPAVPQAKPFGFPHGDHALHALQQQARPQQHQHQLGPFGGLPFSAPPRQVGVAANGLPPAPPSRAAPVAVAHPKASSISGSSLLPENASFKDQREKNREGSVSVVQDRKVRFLDDAPRTLYSLCRSWVRNGPIEEIQSDCDDGVKLLPRPLPPSATDITAFKRTEREEDETNEDTADSVENLSPSDMLDIYVKRAKRIRARLKDERLQRIERYKQRLALLLPPPTDYHRNNDAVP